MYTTTTTTTTEMLLPHCYHYNILNYCDKTPITTKKLEWSIYNDTIRISGTTFPDCSVSDNLCWCVLLECPNTTTWVHGGPAAGRGIHRHCVAADKANLKRCEDLLAWRSRSIRCVYTYYVLSVYQRMVTILVNIYVCDCVCMCVWLCVCVSLCVYVCYVYVLVYISDRRLLKSVKMLCVSAASHGRREVSLADCLLLKHVLWQTPDGQPDLIKRLWRNLASEDSAALLYLLTDMRKKIAQFFQRGNTAVVRYTYYFLKHYDTIKKHYAVLQIKWYYLFINAD